jgi:hypothetical protein
VRFYIRARESGGATIEHPHHNRAHVAGTGFETVTLFSDNFETDLGWTVSGDATSGQWERVQPLGYGRYGRVPIDVDGSGWCLLTEQESSPWFFTGYDVDNGATRITSPLIDMTGGNPLIHYARWLSTHTGDAPFQDYVYVYISNNDGLTWRILDMAGGAYQSSGGWIEKDIWIEDVITPTDQMRIAFEVSDEGEDSDVEAGIDDFSVTLYTCGPEPVITTETLPDAFWEEPYLYQLEHAGGYGYLMWTDKYDELVGTGLQLGITGKVGGTPTQTGEISFTAKAVDEFGRIDEQPLTLTVVYPFVCGDANGDDACNVGDAVHLINYVFKAGPAPDPLLSGDANWDGNVDVGDAVYIINFVFKGGPAPACE